MGIGKLLGSIVMAIVALVICFVALLTWYAFADRSSKYSASNDDLIVPSFDTQTIDFIPSYDGTKTLPFAAGAIIDINNDETMTA